MKALTPGDRVVPWIDNLPKKWPINPLKYCISINDESLTEKAPGQYELFYIDISCVTSTGKINTPELLTFDEAPTRARRIVRKGDTIISTVRTYLKAIAFIDDPSPNLICSTGFAVVRPGQEVFPKFLFYWCRSSFFVDEICARSVGVSYPAINASEIGSLPFPMISLLKQKQIAQTIDIKLNKIDAMIETASRLLPFGGTGFSSLIEYRDALISAAVLDVTIV